MFNYMPTNLFVISTIDFQLRTVFFIVLFLLGLFVNKTYIAKLTENNQQVIYQKLVSDISSDFVSSRNGSLSEKINATLVRTCDFFKADRTFINLFDDHISMMSQAYFNSSNGAGEDKRLMMDLPVADFKFFTDKLLNREIIYVDDILLLPEEVSNVQDYCISRNIRSFMLIPVEYDGAVRGFFGFDLAEPRNFRREYPADLLRTIANLLADGIARIKAENKIENMAFYDQLTG